MQLVGISLNPFEVLSQGAYYGLFHGVRLLCHSCIPGSLALFQLLSIGRLTHLIQAMYPVS